MPGYAILGWGSLLWDLDDLAPHVHPGWAMGAGPALPMEFTRISPKRKQGLVVIVDHAHGVPCPTHAIRSRRAALEPAIDDLARRERTTVDLTGGVCVCTGVLHGRPEIAAIVAEWCTATGWDGAVWTDLPGNFAEKQGAPFTIERAIAYLQTLTGESLDEAVRYIENAPAETVTPLRRALAADPWWQDEARRHR